MQVFNNPEIRQHMQVQAINERCKIHLKVLTLALSDECHECACPTAASCAPGEVFINRQDYWLVLSASRLCDCVQQHKVTTLETVKHRVQMVTHCYLTTEPVIPITPGRLTHLPVF